MKRRLVTVAAAAAALTCLALVAAVTTLTLLVDTPRVRSLITQTTAQALTRPVTLSSISVALLPRPALRLKRLEVGEEPRFATAPFLMLDEVDLQLRLSALVRGRVEIAAAILRHPQLTFIQRADGNTNTASLGVAAAAPSPLSSSDSAGIAGAVALLPSRIKIEGGVVSYTNQDIQGPTSQYQLEQLDLALDTGRVVRFGGSARLQPGDLGLTLTDGTVALNDAAALAELPVRARIAVDGKDITNLVAVALGPAPAIGGTITATLALAGTLGALTAAGDVELKDASISRTSPQCSNPQQRTLLFPGLKADAEWSGSRFTSESVTARLGSGTITAGLVVRLDGPLRVELKDVAITDVPLDTFLVDFLCAGYAVTGSLGLTGGVSMASPSVANTLTGFGQLDIRRGKVVGPQALGLLAAVVRVGGAVSALLNADLPWALFSSPLDFDSITATFQISNGVLSTRDLVYTGNAMKISVSGDYQLGTEQLNLEMVINHGRGEVNATVTGPAASPSIRVRPSTILRGVDPKEIGRTVQNFFKGLH